MSYRNDDLVGRSVDDVLADIHKLKRDYLENAGSD